MCHQVGFSSRLAHHICLLLWDPFSGAFPQQGGADRHHKDQIGEVPSACNHCDCLQAIKEHLDSHETISKQKNFPLQITLLLKYFWGNIWFSFAHLLTLTHHTLQHFMLHVTNNTLHTKHYQKIQLVSRIERKRVWTGMNGFLKLATKLVLEPKFVNFICLS